MELTISSLKLGRAFTFFCACDGDRDAYVYVDVNGQPGTLGRQICSGGRLMGSTLRATEASFESTCRNWMRQHAQHPDEVAYGASLSEVRMRRGTRTVSIRLTPLQHEKLLRLGGSAWVARKIDEEEEPF